VACDFSTDSEFAEKASRVKDFVWDEVKPLNAQFPGCEYLPITDERRKIVDPINSRSAIAGIWALHLGPELGGQGFGAVKLINEILGRTACGVQSCSARRHPTPATPRISTRFSTPE
jgi:acyl-CoA dehydrogenase